jgi:ammonium transporter, Amt family
VKRLLMFAMSLLLGLSTVTAMSSQVWAEEAETSKKDIPITLDDLSKVAKSLNEQAIEGGLYTTEEVEVEGKKVEKKLPYFKVTATEVEETVTKVTITGEGDDAKEETVEETNKVPTLVVEGLNTGADFEWEASAARNDDGEIESGVAMILSHDFYTSNLWIMIAAMLVFIMHLGFAMVESGLTRAKNTVNILFKNTMIPMIGLTMYAICGWLIMYPGESWIIGDFFAFGLGIGGGDKGSADWVSNIANNTPYYHASYTVWTDFLFQGMFAATCATIVSGAVAGRVKLGPFLLFSIVFVGLIYPITGSWQWGGGWLADMGFADFAGSTLVHAVGGVGALVGAIILGPRIGKYAKDGSVQPIPGHSMPMVTIGVFLLWFGWFGFNGGSELAANPEGVSWVLVTTSIAACGGGLACALCSWFIGGKPDLSMALNGILAGLVGITAGPNTVDWFEALVFVGAISGVLAYFSVMTLDKLKIDDPVGAISVHLICGIYGTLCCGLWGDAGLFNGQGAGQLITQLIGAVSCVAFAGVAAAIIFGILKATVGIRVSEHEELEGLDLGEHDMAAYPDFQQTYIKSYHSREI